MQFFINKFWAIITMDVLWYAIKDYGVRQLFNDLDGSNPSSAVDH